jgi:peptidyl-Lys metalloendopeptidase
VAAELDSSPESQRLEEDMRGFHTWKCFAIALLFACAGAQAAPEGVAVTITPERAAVGKDDDVRVRVTVTNTSASPARLLKWALPFDAIEAPLFEVTRDGVKARYLGVRVKRAAPTDEDYVELAPGASRTATVELSSLYEMSVTGAYTVRYHSASLQLEGTPKAPASAIELESEPASIWLDGRLPRGTIPPEPLSLQAMQAAAGLTFNKCSNAQQSQITSAANAALAMATDGEAYLAKSALASRYGQWFGAVDKQRPPVVKAHFAAIKDAFATRPVTVDCGCNKPYYAYVYPSQPYLIYVCRAFWSAPMTGTDSKGGTLVHEMSHFTVVAGTDDFVYGQMGAASLAASDPAKAIQNADSHEYFGENTPELSVRK